MKTSKKVLKKMLPEDSDNDGDKLQIKLGNENLDTYLYEFDLIASTTIG